MLDDPDNQFARKYAILQGMVLKESSVVLGVLKLQQHLFVKEWLANADTFSFYQLFLPIATDFNEAQQ